MSALDLFASAMGAFVLLTVLMLPFYFKGKEYETEIGDLELALSESTATAARAAAAVSEVVDRIGSIDDLPASDLTAEQKALRTEQQRQRALARTKADLQQSIEASKRALAEAQ